jgi:hypothetical protein
MIYQQKSSPINIEPYKVLYCHSSVTHVVTPYPALLYPPHKFGSSMCQGVDDRSGATQFHGAARSRSHETRNQVTSSQACTTHPVQSEGVQKFHWILNCPNGLDNPAEVHTYFDHTGSCVEVPGQ